LLDPGVLRSRTKIFSRRRNRRASLRGPSSCMRIRILWLLPVCLCSLWILRPRMVLGRRIHRRRTLVSRVLGWTRILRWRLLWTRLLWRRIRCPGLRRSRTSVWRGFPRRRRARWRWLPWRGQFPRGRWPRRQKVSRTQALVVRWCWKGRRLEPPAFSFFRRLPFQSL
jgi:hypothetical protein